mmetsp:Transcript_9268/g.22610  ORF Transcript_9268/g.22610 Transcript_9268/m.22610 type:complete len:169 (-) Transcript_9268:724-1230(-)
MAGNIRIWPAILPATIMVCRYIWPAILPRPYLSCRPYLQPQLDRSAIINACKSFDLLGNPVQPAKHEQTRRHGPRRMRQWAMAKDTAAPLEKNALASSAVLTVSLAEEEADLEPMISSGQEAFGPSRERRIPDCSTTSPGRSGDDRRKYADVSSPTQSMYWTSDRAGE